jgi:3-oxoadipate enol-lactonase
MRRIVNATNLWRTFKLSLLLARKRPRPKPSRPNLCGSCVGRGAKCLWIGVLLVKSCWAWVEALDLGIRGELMPYITIESQTRRNIYYDDTGGSGPVIVFSHGFLMDRTMFAPQIQVLKSRYRCISWDQRGHGMTATDRLYPFDFYDSAQDLADLLQALKIKNAVLVGMSQGGFLTLRYALTNLGVGVVRALILIDTEADVMPPDAIKANDGLLQLWTSKGYSQQLADAITGQIIGPTQPGFGSTLLGWQTKWGQTTFPNLIQSFNALTTRDDVTLALGAIKWPALVLHGTADATVPIAKGQAMAQGLANAKFVPIQGAGHASCLTFPNLVNPQITSFLDHLSVPGASAKAATAQGDKPRKSFWRR